MICGAPNTGMNGHASRPAVSNAWVGVDVVMDEPPVRFVTPRHRAAGARPWPKDRHDDSLARALARSCRRLLRRDHGPDARVGEDLEQQHVGDATVEDVGAADAVAD